MKKQCVFVLICLLIIPLTFAQTRPRQYHRIPLGPNAFGPESVAFDCKGRGPYVGVSDGRILRWKNHRVGWIEFAVTTPNRTKTCDGVKNSPMEQFCGRPLGLKFNAATCELYIADSSFGLMKVGRCGGVATPLATSAEGIPFRFLNALDLDVEGGAIYFTDTSSNFNRWESLKAITTERPQWKTNEIRYADKKCKVLLRNLSFANGVALSKKKDFVLVAETTRSLVRKLWLTGPKTGVSEVFIDLQGSGRPDNIHRNKHGDFWVAMNPNPPVKIDEDGRILEVLSANEIVSSSDVSEIKNSLWIGFVVQDYVVYTT